jgi:photosystem II stability/assembly factor-like uncharacterized protein
MKKARFISALVFAGATLALFGFQPPRTDLPTGAAGWKPIGPEGGFVKSVLAAKNNPDDMIAVTLAYNDNSSFIYRSRDGGGSWQKIAKLNDPVYDAKRSPSNPSLLYALARDRFYRSTDEGKTWTAVLFPRQFYTFGHIAIDPRTPSRIYLSGSYTYKSSRSCMAVAKSGDGGANWTYYQVFPTWNTGQASLLALDPLKPTTVYLGGYSYSSGVNKNYLCKSSDGGANWTDISGSFSNQPSAIAIDPVNPKNIIIGWDRALYRTTNGGASWLKAPKKYNAWALAIDPADPKSVYAGSDNTIFKTTDGGQTWKTYSTGFQGIGICFAFTSGGLLAGTNCGILASANGGKTWIPSNSGIAQAQTTAIAIAPSAPQTIYAAVDGAGPFRSEDGGSSWAQTHNIGKSATGDVPKIAVDPTDPNVLYASYYEEDDASGVSGLYRSMNAGDTWTRIIKNTSNRVMAHGQYPGYVYTVGTTKSSGKTVMALYASEDRGDHWIVAPVPSNVGSYPYAFACHPTDPKTVYLGGYRKDNGRCFIAKTTDLGATWTLMTYSGHSYDFPYAIAIDPNNPKRILVGTGRGIFRSENDGQTWSLKGVAKNSSVILFDPATPGAVYVGWSNGVMRSLDGGKNWQAFNPGMEVLYVNGLALDSAGKILYAATMGSGVCKRIL